MISKQMVVKSGTICSGTIIGNKVYLRFCDFLIVFLGGPKEKLQYFAGSMQAYGKPTKIPERFMVFLLNTTLR